MQGEGTNSHLAFDNIYIYMKKNILIAVLVLVVLVLAGVTLYQSERLGAAKAYINDLETDYPDYLDTTSGGDAYSEWYN